MFDDMPNEYVYWSRIANLKYTAEHNRSDFLTRVVTQKVHSVIPSVVGDVLHAFGLEKFISKLSKFKLTPETILTEEVASYFENFIVSIYDDILKVYEEETKISEQMLKKIIGKCNKVAIVDVGWLGSGPLGIKWLVEEKLKLKCEVKCYVAASTYPKTSFNINELMNETTETYIFSRLHNRSIYDSHRNSNKGTNNIYFEFFTQACHPSFSGFSKNGEYLFDVPEVKNYEKTKDIQKGIFEFSQLYLKFSKNNKYLRNISGYDAYMPYRFVTKSLKLIKTLFSDATYSRSVSVNVNSQGQETISDICKKVNI